jgi:hypothetical protein
MYICNMKKFLILLLLFPFMIFAQIATYNLEATWSIDEVQDLYTQNNLPYYIGDINYAVNGYKVSYYTLNEDDNLVLVSGVLFLPVNPSCPSPILSWQHGTIVSDMQAPSQNINDNILGVVSASHGYVVVVSDYLGLGEGEGIHNYCHSETEASAVIDLIIEGKNIATTEGVNISDQLFLMGYSQGGHSTMAAVKEIELNYSNIFNITASCPMAGPYSMSNAQASMLDLVYPNPGYFPYVIFSYQNVYGNLYNNPNELFMPGFENLFNMYDGSYSMTEINEEIWSIAEDDYGISQVTFTPLHMIKDSYYQNYLNDASHPFKLALQDNDLIDFIPQSPMRLIHCNGDDNVAYENSILAFNSFSQFTTQEIVLLDGGNFNHSDCSVPSIISAKLFFDELVNVCDDNTIIELNLDKELVNVVDYLGRNIDLMNKYNFCVKLYSDGSFDKVMKF